jgi:hypothetical protein
MVKMLNFKDISNNVTRSFHRVGFQFKKHSPEILIGAGIVGGITSAVMACKATTKVNFVLEETKAQVDIIHAGAEKGEVKAQLDNGEIALVPYSEEDAKKDLTIVYAQTGLKLVKLYGPAVLLGAASIAGILTSHNILRKRNIALAAAYTVVDTGFKEYRGRVVERFGEALDRELKYNIKAQEIEEVEVNEKGKEKTVKKTVEVIDPNTNSVYARFFDDGCKGWTKDASTNLYVVTSVQNVANEMLKSRGYLFLNEVYEMLGIYKTAAGQTVGWIYDEDNPIGDNFVDFGIYNANKPSSRDFVNGIERVILLDFNVDGPILDRVKFHRG